MDYAKTVSTFENVFTGQLTTDIPDEIRYCVANITQRDGTYFIKITDKNGVIHTNSCNGVNDTWCGWDCTIMNSKVKSGTVDFGSVTAGVGIAKKIIFKRPFEGLYSMSFVSAVYEMFNCKTQPYIYEQASSYVVIKFVPDISSDKAIFRWIALSCEE